MAAIKTLKLRGEPLVGTYLCCKTCGKQFGNPMHPLTVHKIKDNYYCDICSMDGPLAK